MMCNKAVTRLIIIVIAISCAVAKKKSEQGVQEFIEKEIKKYSGPCPKKITRKSIDHFRWTTEPKKSILCVLLAVQDSGTDGHLWSVLGTLYTQLELSSQASTCFKQATRLSGKITPSSEFQTWDFIGPFVIGKMELDGDHLEAYGGIQNVSKYRNSKAAKFYSELVPGGEIKWKSYTGADDGLMKINPVIEWNDLVSSLGSLGITEWQGWVIKEFAVNDRDQNVLIQCLGVHTVYIDGTPVTGDVYHRTQFWMGLHLSRGIHTISIKLRTKVAASFKCDFRISQSSVDVLPFHYLPDLTDGYLFGTHISIPVANYHHSKWVKVTRITISDQSDGQLLESSLVKPVSIAPGQLMAIPVELRLADPTRRLVEKCSTVNVYLKLSTSEGALSTKFDMRCRNVGESFLFTFLDHDGSVQHAAAIAPIEGCKESDACPVILTYHGTTVPPQNQADSYKHMKKGTFLFGAKAAWVLAPTRHGAHNWEGPGCLTSLTALDRLSELTTEYSWVTQKANSMAVVYAGHSMGGHGSWHLATHYPDRALAVISLAGWIKKEEYGDSNLFFKHDLATSHVDPAVKAVMEACIVENDADKHISNLQDVPVLMRIGEKDRTVHPFFMRRMYRLLKEIEVMVNYTELKNKEHWWWDTWETNDGGVVNDRQLREFTDKHVQQSMISTCDQSGQECTSHTDRYKDYHSTFTLTCYNPALGEGLNGIRVLQQRTPFRLSKIQGTVTYDTVTLTTTNVASLVITEPPNRSINWSHKQLQVDGKSVDLKEHKDGLSTGGLYLCFKSTGEWSVCDRETSTLRRGPESYGPARRVAEAPFIIVIDTSSQYTRDLERLAVYIANLFFLTSDTVAHIVRLEETNMKILEEHNLIILSLTPENLDLTASVTGLSYSDSIIKLENCRFSDTRTGLLTLLPSKNGAQRLHMLLSGNSIEGLRDAVALATPTIPPMTRSPFSNLLPDFVVTGPEFGLKGPGGFLCAGFWGNHWEFRQDLASCVCV